MNKINEIVGVNITRLRNINGLTQSQLGELCGVEYGTVQRWEKGKTWPKPEHVILIASAFQVNPSVLYAEVSDKPEKIADLTKPLDKYLKKIPLELLEALSQMPESKETDQFFKDMVTMTRDEIEHQASADQSQAHKS